MGHSNVWYADAAMNSSFRRKVLEYVKTGGKPPFRNSTQRAGHARQPDPHLRALVEDRAIALATDHFKKLHYKVKSVSKDNLGWDLEAEYASVRLLLEVKGLSQKHVSIELTPNEYTMMQRHSGSYRLCVVTNALSAHGSLHVFGYSPDSRAWESEEGEKMEIREMTAARMFVSD
jgi:hypothetical protein